MKVDLWRFCWLVAEIGSWYGIIADILFIDGCFLLVLESGTPFGRMGPLAIRLSKAQSLPTPKGASG
jgi:hypothetical protein